MHIYDAYMNPTHEDIPVAVMGKTKDLSQKLREEIISFKPEGPWVEDDF